MRYLFIVLGILFTSPSLALAQDGADGALRAGAARVDITPPESALPNSSDILRDHIYVRAIAITNGPQCAIFVGVDQNSTRNDTVAEIIERTAPTTHCPPENYVFTGTRTHSSGTRSLSAGVTGMRGRGTSLPTAQTVKDAMQKAISDAYANRRPARVGYGTTQIDLNVNRDLYAGGRWREGPNPNGPSDKTLSVIALLAEDDSPIAFYVNYAMHCHNFEHTGVFSADYPGDVQRYLEGRFDNQPVAIYSQGTTGDQIMKIRDPYRKLMAVRVGGPEAWDEQLSGRKSLSPSSQPDLEDADRIEAMNEPVPDENLAAYKSAFAAADRWSAAVGAMIGESALEVAKTKMDFQANAKIWGGQKSFSCPGRDYVLPRLQVERLAFTGIAQEYKDGPPIEIKVGVLRIGDIYLTTINGDVYTDIGLRIKRESPAAKTMVVTIANGFTPNNHYLYSDAAAHQLTFQIIASRLEPGCAEGKIVSTAMDLIHQAQ